MFKMDESLFILELLSYAVLIRAFIQVNMCDIRAFNTFQIENSQKKKIKMDESLFILELLS